MNIITENMKIQLKIESQEDNSDKPYIPFEQTLINIPQNLPIGTKYSIGLKEEERKQTMTEKVDIIGITINNIIEILSFIVLRQIPDILEKNQEKMDKIQEMLKNRTINIEEIENLINKISTPETSNIDYNKQIITLKTQLSALIKNQQQETLRIKEPLQFISPIRLT